MARLLPAMIFYGKEPLFARHAVMSASSAFEELAVLVDKPSTRNGYVCFRDYTSDDSTFFKNNYQHLSTNGFESELFCFLRWFYLRDYARANNYTHILHLDHDVLVCGTREDILRSMLDYDICISNVSGHTSYFTLEALEGLCNYFLYFVKDGYKKYIYNYIEAVEKRTEFGISDMTALKDFFDITSLKKNNAPIGIMININFRENGCIINHKTRILDLYVYNGGVYAKRENGEFIRYFTLHFQGIPAKHHLPKFYKFFIHNVYEPQPNTYVRYGA